MSQRIRVATYNLYLGADLGLLLGDVEADRLEEHQAEVLRQLHLTAFPGRAHAIAKLLVAEQVDLVGLQEVCTWRADGQLMWDTAEELLKALQALDEPYDVVVSQPSFSGAEVVERAGLQVTMQLEGHNVILRRRRSDIRIEETRTGIFDSALTAQLSGSVLVSIARGWCGARCTVAGGTEEFAFVNAHTEAYEAASRDRQRSELVTALPGTPGLVLVGDFNATPEQVGMPPELRDAWVEAGNPEDPAQAATCCQAADLSNETSQLSERIDYVWVRGLAVEACRRFGADPADRTGEGQWPSDHAGVAATVVID